VSFSDLAKRLLPNRAVEWIRGRHLRAWPPVGLVRFGSLRRVRPISESVGFDRGLPVDRWYIENWLGSVSGVDIRGRVLEIKEDLYSTRFGVGVERVDVLDIHSTNEQATIVADLTCPDDIPEAAFDCVVCTQTLHLIYDFRSAIGTLHRALRPGGVALVTVPGISAICADEWHWRFSAQSAGRAFEEFFPRESVSVRTYGNVLSAAAFLYGLAAEDLRTRELEAHDPRYEVVLGVRAVKPPAPDGDRPARDR
jgi:SAM-dependent methyltransferase